MIQQQTSESVYWMLLRFAFWAKSGLAKLAEKHDLSVVQLYTLGVLEPDVPTPMNTVSTVLRCDASNVTGIVDRLLTRGYIERNENSLDRRVKMISLTDEGKQLRTRLFEEMAAFQMPEFNSLDIDQQSQLRELLSLIVCPKK
jgi:DNA-binding MarR family transcriptional regulator